MLKRVFPGAFAYAGRAVFNPSAAAAVNQQARFNSTLIKQVGALPAFREAIAPANLSVVDFYADWCGPCKAIAPVVEKFASDYASRDAKFLKVDVDNAGDIAQEYGITAMPTFLLFKNGEPVGKIMGANPKGLQRIIEENL